MQPAKGHRRSPGQEGKSVVFSDAVLGKFPAACFNGMGRSRPARAYYHCPQAGKEPDRREAENCQTKAAGTLKYTFPGSIVGSS